MVFCCIAAWIQPDIFLLSEDKISWEHFRVYSRTIIQIVRRFFMKFQSSGPWFRLIHIWHSRSNHQLFLWQFNFAIVKPSRNFLALLILGQLYLGSTMDFTIECLAWKSNLEHHILCIQKCWKIIIEMHFQWKDVFCTSIYECVQIRLIFLHRHIYVTIWQTAASS